MKKDVMLEKFREFTRDSEITEKDALEMGNKVNKNLAKKYR